jgi:BirA family biotin operon repressor/biotin-[acetyl-CoA-carboxylase] ligase
MDRKLDELLYTLTQNMTVAASGERLARDLNVSHSTLTRWIDKLRAAGVEIRGELFAGYRLTRVPDVILPQLLRPRLRTRTLARTIYHFYSVDSTNAFAARLIAHGRKVPDGTLVVAESQTAGRGRMGRSWHSETGTGLYLSLVLRPQVSPRLAPLFTLACAAALHDAVEGETGVEVDVKWPNDLLAGGRKIAGILAEMQAEVDRVTTLIVGAGLNVNQTGFPDEIAARATSLRIASGRPHSRIEILLRFLEQFEALLARFHQDGPSVITAEWTRVSSFAYGRRLRIGDGSRTIEGTTRGLNAFGALCVETAEGRIEEVYSGDVLDH